MLKDKQSLIVLFILLALVIFVWTKPFASNSFPYGDVDSSTHFILADYMATFDEPIFYLPYYINGTIGGVTSGYGSLNQGKLWYPPQYHTSLSLYERLSPGRVRPVFLFFAFTSASIVFTIFIFIRGLYGWMPAAAASFLILFSIRDIQWFLWGQYPQIISFALIPLTLFAYYTFLNSTINPPVKPVYLYLAAISSVMQFFFHPQAIVPTVLTGAIFSIAFVIKTRKIPIKQLKHFALAIGLAVVIGGSFLQFPLGEGSVYKDVILSFPAEVRSESGLALLLNWYGAHQTLAGTPPWYWSFKATNPGWWWLVPLVIIGVLLLLHRRKLSDLLLLSWILAFYLITHLDFLSVGRVNRFLEVELHILASIAAVSLIILVPAYVRALIKLKYNLTAVRLILVVIFIVLAFTTYGNLAISNLSSAYQGPFRITQPQLDVSNWMKDNLPKEADVFMLGTPIYTKKKWIQGLAQRQMDWSSADWTNSTHVIVDYSDYPFFGQNFQPEVEQIQQLESILAENSQIVYQKDLIRVYKIG